MTTARPTRRWYRLTPDRLLAGLLAIEGFLLLSERFQWFAFNRHKGWTVLIAVASVALVVLLLLAWFLVGLLFRRRFQFGIRSLLVLILAVAIPCSWLKVEMRQRAAIEAIAGAGGEVYFEHQYLPSGDRTRTLEPPGPAWLRRLLGNYYFATAVGAIVVHPENMDGGLAHLARLSELRSLTFYNARIESDGMRHVSTLGQLRSLSFSNTQVTPEEFRCASEVKQLRSLSVANAQVTPWAMAHLEGLSGLRYLNFDRCHLTDAGLKHLAGLTGLEVLSLPNNDLTDAGLQHLKGMKSLTELNLFYNRVTDAGLDHLKGLTALQRLCLANTEVTDEGVRKLRESLPNCAIRR